MKDKKPYPFKVYPFVWKGKINKHNRKNFARPLTDENGYMKLCK